MGYPETGLKDEGVKLTQAQLDKKAEMESLMQLVSRNKQDESAERLIDTRQIES